MTAYEKPGVSVREAEQFLRDRYGDSVTKVVQATGGNLSRVYFFDLAGRGCVIRFTDLPGGFDVLYEVSEKLCAHDVKFQRFIEKGVFGPFCYSIAERIDGTMLADASEQVKRKLLPSLVQELTKLNLVPLGMTHGFGWVRAGGHGGYATWSEYIEDFYGEDQTGTFWENWTELFHTSCLEKPVFDECRARLAAYKAYNEPHRYLVHNDSHPWNILTDGSSLTGIIDGNFIYGDFLIDLSIVERAMPGLPVIDTFRAHYEQIGLDTPDFRERLLGAHYYKGLDALRFNAKMGWVRAYEEARDFLLKLV